MNKFIKTNESNKLTNISITHENYLKLKKLGGAGDSFNDVITELLKRMSQSDPQVPTQESDCNVR
jgi:predicted CopG family antitoxin